MRIFKGSSITLELPVHVCGAGNFSIEKVVIYTDNPNNAVEFRNHMLIDEVLHVYVNSNSLDVLNDGVINYIVEGDGIYIEKMSSYFLKSPKDYTAVSLELEKREVTVTTNNSTTTITKNPQYIGMEEVKIHTEIPLEEDKSYEFTENNTSFDIVADEGYEGIKSGKVTVNIPTQTKIGTFTDNGVYEVVPDEGKLLDKVEVNVDIPLESGKRMYATTNNIAVEIKPSDGYKGVAEGKVYVEIPTQDEKTVNIIKNGTTEVLPDEGYNYIKKVNINTDVTLDSVPILPNGICLSGSTWETFDITQYDWSKVRDMGYMFQSCSNLTSLDVSNWDTSKVTAMYSMFHNCKNITSLDVSNWDTSKVTAMNSMFYYCTNLTSLDVSNWDVSNVTTMSNMFNNCSNLTSLDVSNWDTSKVTNMYSMFQYCYKLTELKMGGDVSKVTNVSSMFGSIKTTGTFYYNPQYDYSKIIAVLPSTWTAVPME
jgi:surface protein